ncbi:7288_t:CDS:2 [Cetraspora pellucida]|uniref:7288_t:CDS:1 n=1 Tax=Cetraspora pellucida TaxID=1433469 RepID=A0A9N9I4M8_9GLOM|nr:7288_t:CDS:2 [Cetraspora pellucida]
MALVLIAQIDACKHKKCKSRPKPSPTTTTHIPSCRVSCPPCATHSPIHCDIACQKICD